MNKKQSLKRLFTTVFLSVLMLVPTFGASIGDVLIEPEDGWQRIIINKDDLKKISISEHILTTTASGRLDDYTDYTLRSSKPSQSIKFRFRGTDLKITSFLANTCPKDCTITIDGVTDTVNLWKNPSISGRNILVYEKRGLENGIHEVAFSSGTNIRQRSTIILNDIYINSEGELLPYNYQDSTILDIIPAKDTVNLNEVFTTDLVIDNISEIAAEDILIDYDETKLEFVGVEEIPGIKMVYSKNDTANGQLRLILASQGEANVVKSKKILLKIKFKGTSVGDGLIDITTAKVTDGITIERDLLEKECDQAIVKIEAPKDVNRTGEFTLLDLGIDARHFGKNPTAPELSAYDTDVVINNAIDNDDLLKIGQEMLLNSNYALKK